MQKMVSYDYKKSFYISGHIPGTIRGGDSRHFFYYLMIIMINTSLAQSEVETHSTFFL